MNRLIFMFVVVTIVAGTMTCIATIVNHVIIGVRSIITSMLVMIPHTIVIFSKQLITTSDLSHEVLLCTARDS